MRGIHDNRIRKIARESRLSLLDAYRLYSRYGPRDDTMLLQSPRRKVYTLS